MYCIKRYQKKSSRFVVRNKPLAGSSKWYNRILESNGMCTSHYVDELYNYVER